MSDKLFDALSDLDGLCAELEDIGNLLMLLDENISSDLAPLRRDETWGGQYILNRAPLHESLLNVIHLRLRTICKEMQAGISKGYEARKERGSASSIE